MGTRYHCDDCGEEMGEFENVAGQLDMVGKAYCFRCLSNHPQTNIAYTNSQNVKMSLVTPLKNPIPNTSKPVWEMVIEDMKARDQFGRNKYGTPLQLYNGRSFLIDAYQEALDLVVYLRGLIEETKGE